MSLEVLYKVIPKVVTNQNNVTVLRNGELQGTTPFTSQVRTTTLAENGGTFSYTADKTGFTSNVQYKLFLIRNPEFDIEEQENPRREIDRVLSEYGPRIIDFNAQFSKSFPDFSNENSSNSSNNFTEFRGEPGDRDSFSLEDQRDREVFSNTPTYVISVLKYVDGVLDDGYIQLASTQNEITLDFELSDETDVEIPDESLDAISITNIVVRNGIPQGVKIQSNGFDLLTLDKSKTSQITSEGDELTFLSSDTSRYRISSLSIQRDGSELDSFEAGENESLSTSFITNENSATVIIDVEEVFVEEPIDTPQIEFVDDSVRKFNLNGESPLPIGITKLNKVDSLRVIIGETVKTFSDLGSGDSFVATLNKNVFPKIGLYKIKFIPRNEERGDGREVVLDVNVVEETFVGVPDLRRITYPETITGPAFVGFDVEFDISWSSINTDYVRIYKGNSDEWTQVNDYGKITLNVSDFVNVKPDKNFTGGRRADFVLRLVPFNASTQNLVKGKEEVISISFIENEVQITRSQAINRIVSGFLNDIDINSVSLDTSKYLSHNLHLGNGDNKVVTTYTGSEDTLILKLYEPLESNVQPNQQVWLSKLQTNPIVETVTLNGLEELVCKPLKGPNFSINTDESLGFRYYDDLIASGSPTQDELLDRYFDNKNIDTSKLNIEYVSGSTYLFENFTNFGSAEERVRNFFYKIQLIETYNDKIESLGGNRVLGELLSEDNPIDSTIDGYTAVSPVFFTEDDILTLDVEQTVIRNPNEAVELDRTVNNLRTTISSFDGFEKFLYLSTDALSYPKVTIPLPSTEYPKTVLKSTDSLDVIDWYQTLLNLAIDFDKNNPNYMVNNLPNFIVEDNDNSSFLLFLDMIGQHFDAVWSYVNALKRMKVLDESLDRGVPKDFVSSILKSFGWDTRRAFDSQFLWEYALGKNREGNQKFSVSLEEANNQVWKRILNNLPYLLKHKGTSRAMKAIMATYGVPQSMLTIMEFGGPQDPTQGGTTDFTFDDRTAALHLYPSASIDVHWKEVSGDYPYSLEFMIQPSKVKTSNILSSSYFSLDIVQTGSSQAYLEFTLDGNVTQSKEFPLITDDYSGILVSRTPSNYEVLYRTSDGQRLYVTSSLQLDTTSSIGWASESVVKIGNDFTGALDEVRLWGVALEETKFENHVLYPNSINGNSYTSSTADLLFRLDFEYPLDFIQGTSTVPSESVKNVSISEGYQLPFASASNFSTESVYQSYPYNYIPYDRTVTTKVPSLGFNYANKVRVESQTLISDLSHKKRATKKSFDQAPIDSSRLGIFFSPIKELNMDIVKSLGDFNIDNYIGDPSDDYREDYRELQTLRNYYFERISRNTHEYIRLIKYVSKTLFDVLEDLVPARAKAAKGLLIEPHFLERSKTKWDKPETLRKDYPAHITASDDVTLNSENILYNGVLDIEEETELVGDERFFNSLIDVEEETELVGEERFFQGVVNDNLTSSLEGSYPSYNASVSFEFTGSVLSEYEALENFTQVGMNPFSLYNLGFGLYAEDTTGIYKRFDSVGNYTQSRSDIYLIEKTLSREVPVQVSGYPTIGSVEGDQVVVELQKLDYIKKEITILPFGSTAPTVTGDVTKVTPLSGYFPTHYRFVHGLSEGLQRSFYKGSQQTIDTTPDGLSPVQTFETNPNILRVADTGRGNGEPILEVD